MNEKKYAAQLKSLQQDERFEALTALFGEHLEKWGNESPKRDSEFETIYALGVIDGKRDGLREFFLNMEKYGSSS